MGLTRDSGDSAGVAVVGDMKGDVWSGWIDMTKEAREGCET